MKLGMRWFGTGYDTVPLKYIRQVPGVKGVITTLYGTLPGDVWERDAIRALKDEVEAAGLEILGIESVNVSRSSGNTVIDKAAMQQARQGKFKPFTKDGVARVGNVTLSVSYKMP